MRTIQTADIQTALLFFGRQAADYFRKHKTLPPACVLVWLAADAPEISGLHQFPTDQVVEMLATEAGKLQLASAVHAILNPDVSDVEVPPGPRPDLVVQVVLACATKEGLPADKEAILLLVYTGDTTHAVAVPVDAADGRVDLPATFDVAAARIDAS